MRSRSPWPELGAQIRVRRTAAHLSQVDLGCELGISGVAMGKIEKGLTVPSAAQLKALCLLLGVSADVMLGLPAGWGQDRSAAPDDAGFVAEGHEVLQAADDPILEPQSSNPGLKGLLAL